MLFSADEFDYDADLRLYSQEVSTLMYGRMDPPPFRTGLTLMINHQRVAFEFVSVDTSNGDIAGWNFKPTDVAINADGSLVGTKLLIVND